MTATLLEELFDRAPVGMAVLDRELLFLYVNEALADINGVPVEEHLGQAIEDVVPDLAAQAREAFEAVLISERPLRTGSSPESQRPPAGSFATGSRTSTRCEQREKSWRWARS